MAVLAANINGHIHNQLTRSLERILEDANQSGELKLSNRKLKDFPKASGKYNLSDTVIADLSKNRFSELPEEVSEFLFLERLVCYHNAIRHIPDTISSLQCLNFLDLSRNQLTTLPREICLLPIQILLVSNNRLTSLPDELGKMSHLAELDASCNQLTHLPPRMGELRRLQSLILRNNLLLCLPIEVTYLRLVRLDLTANRINTLPVELRDMTSLISLSVEDNPLTSPPASLCRRGQVHIFKYLETEAMKLEQKTGISGGTLGRKSRRSGGTSTPLSSHLTERLRHKRQNVDSGYCTSSDGYDKRWSQEIIGECDKNWASSPLANHRTELNGNHSSLSTPSTVSPSPEATLEEDISKMSEMERREELRLVKDFNNARLSPNADQTLINGSDDKPRQPFQQIQTYREYKEALKQQRAQDVPSVYRTKDSDDLNYKTEPNTPTHTISTSLATSKSDPTPLNSAFSSPKHVFDDTLKSQQKITKDKNFSGGNSNFLVNGESFEARRCVSPRGVQNYIKPKSPMKNSCGGILSHDNVPGSGTVNGNRGVYANGKGLNGVKSGKNISWNKEEERKVEKMSFTMRREIDKAREESDLLNQLRNIIETRLKMALPQDLAPALTDGVVLCHLANHIKPRSVASIHVPSPAVPKLTMARCRRNVDNFIEACRKIGVDENTICCAADVLEGRGLVQVAITVTELIRFHSPRSPLHVNSISTVI